MVKILARFLCVLIMCKHMIHTAILIIIEGHKTAFNGFSTSLLLENSWKAWNRPSIIMRMAVIDYYSLFIDSIVVQKKLFPNLYIYIYIYIYIRITHPHKNSDLCVRIHFHIQIQKTTIGRWHCAGTLVEQSFLTLKIVDMFWVLRLKIVDMFWVLRLKIVDMSWVLRLKIVDMFWVLRRCFLSWGFMAEKFCHNWW